MAIMAQFVNAHMPSNGIALGERLALWHQMTPYVVGGIYADSVEGVGVGGSILYLAFGEGCLPLGLPRSAMRTRELIYRQHISPLDVAALPCNKLA